VGLFRRFRVRSGRSELDAAAFRVRGLDIRIAATSPGKWAFAIALACIGALYARWREESTLIGFAAGAGLGLSAPLFLIAMIKVVWNLFVALTSLLQ
jgi:hypothetical protein